MKTKTKISQYKGKNHLKDYNLQERTKYPRQKVSVTCFHQFCVVPNKMFNPNLGRLGVGYSTPYSSWLSFNNSKTMEAVTLEFSSIQ